MLDDFLAINGLKARILSFDFEVHTAKQASERVKAPLSCVLKTVLFLDDEKNGFLALIPGDQKASATKIARLLGKKNLRLASAEEVFEITGYEAGGLPPISIFGVTTVLDSSFLDSQTVYCGGGDVFHLLEISVLEFKKHALNLLIAPICE